MYLKNQSPEIREEIISNIDFIDVVNDVSILGYNKEYKPKAYQKFINSRENGLIFIYGRFTFIGIKTNK